MTGSCRPNAESESEGHQYSTDIGTVVIEHPRRLKNPIHDESRDMTNLAEDGYLRRFLAVLYAANSPDHVDLSSSPVCAFDKDRWELEEQDGQYVLVKREPESRFDELVMEGSV